MIYNLIVWIAVLICLIGIIFGSIYAIFPTKRDSAKKILKRFSIALGVIVVIFFSFRLYLEYFHGVGEGEKIEGGSIYSIGKVCRSGLKAIGDAIYTGERGPLSGCAYPMCDCFVCAKCGNDICGKGENHCNCPKDCKEGEGVYVESDDPNITSMGTIGSTLEIGGKIKGDWFFEGQFPVKLLDTKGDFVSKGTAVTDWMTDGWVSFEASFPNTNARSGSILFSKDNPSGLPQNDKSVSIPFSF